MMVLNVAESPIRNLHATSKTLTRDGENAGLVQFPEGGSMAWRTVIGSALVQSCGFGYIASFGVYQDFYTSHYLTNESASAISWIGSINAFLVTCTGLVAGTLYDRGYFYYLLFAGSLLQSFSLFMLSLAQPGRYYQIFLAQGVSLGIAQGLTYVPAMAVVSHYFRQRHTLAMSLVTAGSSLGSMIYPILLNNLFNRPGFANTVRISATFISALLFTSCILMRTRTGPSNRPTNYFTVGKGIAHDVPFCIMSVGMLCFQAGFYYPIFYLQLDSAMHGNPETFSFYSLVLLNGGNLIGRLSAGFIAPYIGVPTSTIVSTAVRYPHTRDDWSERYPDGRRDRDILWLFHWLIALLPPLIGILTSDISELGARMEIAVAISGIGTLISGPAAGALLTSQYKWWQPSLFNGLMVLVGAFLLMVMQLARRRKRSDEKQEP